MCERKCSARLRLIARAMGDSRLQRIQEEEDGTGGRRTDARGRCEKLVSQSSGVMRREERAGYVSARCRLKSRLARDTQPDVRTSRELAHKL